MNIGYKEDTVPDKKSIVLEQDGDNDESEISYKSFFDDLFSDDLILVSHAIANLSNLVDQDITIFKDCVAFTKILEICDNPMFEDYMTVLHFFDQITTNSTHDEKFLARFISQSFISTLKNFLYSNFENPDFFRILFDIYSNIIYTSYFFSEQILSSQFLSRLYEIVEHLPTTSDYFLDLLGCILLRFKILKKFPIDPFPKIIELIRFFFDSPDFILFSNVFSTLAQASSITFPPFIKSFFEPFIIQKTFDVIEWQEESNEEDMIKVDNKYTIHKKSFFALKRDALTIILNFSAIDKKTRSQLIDIGLIDLNCIDICFLKEDESKESFIYSSFKEDQIKNKGELIKNDLDSSLLPKIAANFFTDTHSNAIRLAYSSFWKSIITSYEWFDFNTKQEIARAISLALSCHDEDLVTTILSDENLNNVISALTDCFFNSTIKLEVSSIQAINNLIDLFCKHPNIHEINLAFEGIIYSDLISEIKNFNFNEKEEIPASLYPVIERIISFFDDYLESHSTFENDSDIDDGNANSIDDGE